MKLLLSEMRQFRQRDHRTRQQLASYQASAWRSQRVHSAFHGEILAGALQQALKKKRTDVLHVEVQRVAAISKTAAGKSPLIKSNVQH